MQRAVWRESLWKMTGDRGRLGEDALDFQLQKGVEDERGGIGWEVLKSKVEAL